jgi:hypothetical protein
MKRNQAMVMCVKVERDFLEGFLVLGFAIFIVGFLTGMFSLALVALKMDSVLLFVVFSLGLIVGMLAVVLAFMVIKNRQ